MLENLAQRSLESLRHAGIQVVRLKHRGPPIELSGAGRRDRLAQTIPGEIPTLASGWPPLVRKFRDAAGFLAQRRL